MVDSKDKGKRWERDATKLLEEKLGGNWRRIPGSGAIGTIINEPKLTGDISGRVRYIPRNFKFDAKVGYGGSKQMAVKRIWLEKIKEEADQEYAIPALICKFSGSRSEMKHFIVMDIDTFAQLMSYTEEHFDAWLNDKELET